MMEHQELSIKVILRKEGDDLIWYNINGKMCSIMCITNEIFNIILAILIEYNCMLKKRR